MTQSVTIDRTVELLLAEARKQYGDVTPCRRRNGDLKPWGECVSNDLGTTMLWFNCSDGSTRTITAN